MSSTIKPPKMHPVQSTLPSTVPDETLATYTWIPETYTAAVFLLHGFRSHTKFNFLRSDTPVSLHNYGDSTNSSIIRELNLRNIAVFAHDHVGHGNSTGLRAYFPAFSALVADLMAHVRLIDENHKLSARNIPIFLLGHSMGGTVAIVAARDNPGTFAGMALSSAASEPPESMFGLAGKIQLAISGITSALVPKMQLLALPKSTDEELQVLFESDPLNCSEMLRARVGRQFIDAYKDISARIADVKVAFLTASGENDTLVNPAAAQRFHDGAASKDKTYFPAKGRWHNLLVEKGREELWTLFADWIAARAMSSK